MNYLDLFSGIGGFALACKNVGLNFSNHLYSEIEPYAIKVYERNFPQAIGLGNVKEIDGNKLKEQYGPEWFITGGFPCQDISSGGKRKGINAERSGLCWEMLRLVGEIRPKAVLVENVVALRNQGLAELLCSLAQIGYDAEWQTISAAGIGAIHQRERIWIVAYASSDRRRYANVLRSTEGGPNISDSDQRNIQAQRAVVRADWERILAEGKIQDQPVLIRIPDDVSAGMDRRIMALGNAIVPQVAELVLKRIKTALRLP